MQQRSNRHFLICFSLGVMSLMLWLVASASAQEAQKKSPSQTREGSGKQTAAPLSPAAAPARHADVPPAVLREAVAKIIMRVP